MSETQIVQLVALVGFLVLVLGSLSIRRLPLGFILKTVIGWAAIAGVIYLVVVNRHTILDQLNTIGSKVGISEAPQVAEGETIRIQLSPDGHFWARATINGVERRMLIDSGATVSAISEETAQAAGIAFEALKQATDQRADVLIVDTAGRLQNKRELMDELAKIRRVLGRIDPGAPHDVVLVLDATTGQNALSQIEVFKEVAGVTGIVMTKLDGTARGGVLVAAAEKYGLPIHAIGVGEKVDDLRGFDPNEVARIIAGVEAFNRG